MEAMLRTALKLQHHSALAMFRLAISRCPDDVWTGGEHPRNYWRIAFHAAGYAHLYLYENIDAWTPWAKHRKECTWLDGDDIPVMEPYTKAEMMEFIELIDAEVDTRIDALDLGDPSCGFAWYPKVTRVELLILSLRHLHGHIGQLTEILIGHGLDVDWMGEFKPG
jgi:hypothetical protein